MPTIESATYHIEKNSLLSDFAISRGTMTHSESIYIQISNSEGLTGLGESAPFPVLTGDTVSVVCSLCEQYLPSLVALEPPQALTLIQGLWREELFNLSPTFLCGVETALYDLIARSANQPLAYLWGESPLQGLRTDMTLPILRADEVQPFWLLYENCGFSELKIKVGSQSLAEDLERIEATARLTPGIQKMSIDGNQAFSVSRALELLKGLEKRGLTPDLFEQPLLKDDISGMKELTRKSPIPIFADESVVTVADIKNIINERAAHGVNLKIMKSGIRESLEIAQLARTAGMPIMIGGMLETEVAMTTSLHLACGTGLIDWCDLDTPFFITHRTTHTSPYHARQAFLELPSTPGHGLSLLRSAETPDPDASTTLQSKPWTHPYRARETL